MNPRSEKLPEYGSDSGADERPKVRRLTRIPSGRYPAISEATLASTYLRSAMGLGSTMLPRNPLLPTTIRSAWLKSKGS